MAISQNDRARLRELAKEQAELAASERNRRLYQSWMEYGSNTAPSRAMIRIELGTFEQDVLPPLMRCEGERARQIERSILSPIANFTLFEDDTLVPEYYAVRDYTHFTPFGLSVRKRETGGVGHHFIPYISDLEEDEHLLGASRFGVDEDEAAREVSEAGELFGDILPVRRISDCMYCCPTQDIVHIMNMDDMYVSMLTDKERFRAMMSRLTGDYRAFFEMLERGRHIRSAARDQHLNQGSYCFTDELTDLIEGARLKDCWLFMDSQETSGVSPELYAEVVFPYYKELMSLFGLVSYGCCESVHPIWDSCLSKIPNIRKVSISPWCDEEFMGERLRGTGITYLRKPPATLLGVGGELDEAAALACFRKTAKAASGCKLEVAQRDVYRINNTPDKVKRYVSLFRQAAEEQGFSAF